MKFCTNCGSKMGDDFLFCTNCGAPANFVPTPNQQIPTSPLNPNYAMNSASECVYDIQGVRGRRIRVFHDKAIITVTAGIGSFLTGNISDGEKTIYYVDVIGVQFKKSGFQIGYLQLETASAQMNNGASNFFAENSFTFDTTAVSNEMMEEVADFVKRRVEEIKTQKNNPTAPLSPAEEVMKLKSLLDMGVITQQEFDIKKRQLLGL